MESLHEMRNGYAVLPAGTRFTVIRNRGGLTLESDTCEGCGVRVVISNVAESSVKFVAPVNNKG